MIKNVQAYKYATTGVWYATCKSTIHGECTQWGWDEIEARARLRKYVEVQWGEKWPEQKNGGTK